jgi:hypothetical protein
MSDTSKFASHCFCLVEQWRLLSMAKIAETKLFYVSFEVFKALTVNILAFWIVTPCSLEGGYRRFRMAFLQLQD